MIIKQIIYSKNKKLPETNINILENDDTCRRVIRLNIYGVPGMTFYLNNSSYPIVINGFGVYSVENVLITSIKISNKTLNLLKNSDYNTLIIDMEGY